jgi:hypothetical protein
MQRRDEIVEFLTIEPSPRSADSLAILAAIRTAADNAHPKIRVILQIKVHNVFRQAQLDKLIRSKHRW